ncbi:Hint domain-containing protein [Lentibacter algarum]|uniref:Hint domain-containing protein n=1 Tax=Lentibacter algarum TaxID=576131 RepID=UPI001C0960F1|nr:Hint domain-containing protein [Lentibacter algarum]MBU2983075.1 Hint domain-containing protein [Lentibacter algarum]
MSWLAIAGSDEQHYALRGLEPKSAAHLQQGAPLLKGSLVIETSISAEGRPQNLLAHRVSSPEKRIISFHAIPGGGIILVLQSGGQTTHAVVDLDSSERTDLLRITYSWDMRKNWGRLALERPETGWSSTTAISHPQPLWTDDIRSMTLAPHLVQIDSDVEFFAISDQVEPLGPMPSLSASIPVLSQGRYKPVAKIKPRDVVQTVEHGAVSVLGALARTVPARGSFRPVQLRAPYFGLQRDIIVAPDQKLVISQPMVEYMFGCESVLVRARHLVNGTSAIWADSGLIKTYHQLILPAHETLYAAGAALESLFLGRLRRKPEQHAETLLAPVSRSQLPEHMRSVHPVLRPFEAITLVEQCAA